VPAEELVIDGYNLIFRLAGREARPPHEVQHLKEELETAVERYGQGRGVRPWIIYDGKRLGPSHPAARQEPHLRVSYADPPAEADDVIVQMTAQMRARGRRVEVVTSDAGLAARLTESGARIVSVEEFGGRLVSRRTTASPPMGDLEEHFLGLHAWEEEKRERERFLATETGRLPTSAGGRGQPSPAGESGVAGESPKNRKPQPDDDADRRRRRGRRRQERRLAAAKRRGGQRRRRRR
jgi:predicted RNA-binding protein with PIN domain